MEVRELLLQSGLVSTGLVTNGRTLGLCSLELRRAVSQGDLAHAATLLVVYALRGLPGMSAWVSLAVRVGAGWGAEIMMRSYCGNCYLYLDVTCKTSSTRACTRQGVVPSTVSAV